ncbi:MAG: dienelactone hydrolase family protein [Burkholderiales bacterium]|nr:dienelactone hydrolase family protein [Burkholderiales bacterium]
MSRVRLLAALAAATALAGPLRAEPVPITSLDGTVIAAHWLPAPGGGTGPAVLALHGCGGLYNRDGRTLDARYPEYAARLHAAGVHVLLTDSFTPRGARQICSVKHGDRSITVETRRQDAIAAVRWLQTRSEVDPQRIVLLGWSHGAMTLLTAINAARAPHAAPLAGAIAFYPGCRATLQQPFRLDTPLLLLLGEKDDWTPPGRCIALAERVSQAQPQADLTLRVYPDAYHGFDSARPVRSRADVPNGVNPAGVHVGGQPEARAAALAEFDRFITRVTAIGRSSP